MDKRPTIRKVRIGSFRVPDTRKPGTNSRTDLARRYRQHLRGLESGPQSDVDPDVEVRRGPPSDSSRSVGPSRIVGGGFDDDDLD